MGDRAKKFLRGFINIVNPLGEHNPNNYWSYNESNWIRSTCGYGGNRGSRSCDIRRVLNSGWAQK